MWKLKKGFNTFEERLEKAVQYFISILDQGKSIHPFLRDLGFPEHFSLVMTILLLNLTKHGLHNMGSTEAIWAAYINDPKGVDPSLFLSWDFGTLLNRNSVHDHAHFVMLRQHRFNFITCSGVYFKNDINAFIRPFDSITWTCVTLTIAFIVAFTYSKTRLDFMSTFGALIEQIK